MQNIPSGAKNSTAKIPYRQRSGKPLNTKMLLLTSLLLVFFASLLFSDAVSTAAGNAWSGGFSCWKKGDAAGALKGWSAAPLLTPFAKRFNKLSYWRVKALEKLGRDSEAKAQASLMALRAPLDFYTFALYYEKRYPAMNRLVDEALANTDYLRKWRSEVEKASAATGVEKNILWGLIRQESKFRENAVSRSGAVGLMQLMPLTARETAARLKDERLTPYLPTHNIMLGAAHFAHLLKCFGGSVPLAVCAYNAGAGSVSKWKKHKTASWVEWLEEIPYPQTREYLRCVLENIEVYSGKSQHRGKGSFFSWANTPPVFR